MKAYYEYEDGTFWAIRVKGENCFTAHGSKYRVFWPENMLKAGTEEAEHCFMPPDAQRLSFSNPAEAEEQAAKMIKEKSKKNESGSAALKQDAEFWRIAIQISAHRLFFVPEEYKTRELCVLAACRNGTALRYVPPEMQDTEICELALNNDADALEYVYGELVTWEMCLRAVKTSGSALKYIPEKFKNTGGKFAVGRFAELCLTAVKKDGFSLEFVPEKIKNTELCTEAVKIYPRAIKHIPETLKTQELCHYAVAQGNLFLLLFSAGEDTHCALAYIPETLITAEICREAVCSDSESLAFVPDQFKTPKLCLEAIKKHGFALGCLEDKDKTKELCVLAVRSNGNALQYVPMPLRTPKMCLTAVKRNGSALEHVPQALKTPELCLAALEKYPDIWVMRHIPASVKTDDFLIKYFNSINMYSSFEDHTKLPESADFETCLNIVRKNPQAFKGVPENQKTHKLCLEAVRGNACRMSSRQRNCFLPP